MLACKKGYLGEDYLLPNSTNVISLEKLKDIDFILTKKNHRIRKLTENLFDMFDFLFSHFNVFHDSGPL